MRPRVRDAISKVDPYPVPEGTRKDKLRLDMNESTRGCSPKVLEALREAGSTEICTYPEPGELIGKLAAKLGVGKENIILTNGSDDGIRFIMHSYLAKGHDIVMADPTFSMFEFWGDLHDARLVKVPYGEDLGFPIDGMLDAIGEGTMMVVIVNPDSPTGTTVKREDIVRILEKAKGAAVVLDETYHHYLGRSDIDLVEKYPNLFVLQTFSKAYGLAGLRIGYIISDTGNMDTLRRACPPFPVNTMAVLAATVALDDQEYIDEVVADVRKEKEWLAGEYRRLGIGVRMTETNWLVVDLGKDVDAIAKSLEMDGILIKSLDKLPMLKGKARIAVGTHEENERVIAALEVGPSVDTILFDMDGVLVDCRMSYRMSVIRTVEHFTGKEVPVDEGMADIERFKMMGGYNNDWDIARGMIEERGRKADMSDIVAKFQELYVGEDFDGLICKEQWLMDKGLIERLAKDYRLGIVTGRPREEAEHTLKKEGVRKYFGAVIAMEDTPDRWKPFPDGILMAMKALGGNRAVYLGDNIDDIRAASAARVVPVGVRFGSGSRKLEDAMREQGARALLKSVNDIEEVL